MPDTEERVYAEKMKAADSACEGGVNAAFLRHMSQYIGTTVTVYLAGGGDSGSGMTGVLVECGDGYVRLLTKPASAPEKPRGMCGACPFYGMCRARGAERGQRTAGAAAMVDIPAARIVMFVHSAV